MTECPYCQYGARHGKREPGSWTAIWNDKTKTDDITEHFGPPISEPLSPHATTCPRCGHPLKELHGHSHGVRNRDYGIEDQKSGSLRGSIRHPVDPDPWPLGSEDDEDA